MTNTLFIGLFSPLVGSLLLLALSRILNLKKASIIGCSSVLISFICFVTLFFEHGLKTTAPLTATLFTWISTDALSANFSLYLDHISILMTLVVTGVGFLIHVYAKGYMDHDEDFARFYICLNFFIFAMLLLVLADNIVLLFVGWEGVGLASYLLIGHWYNRLSAAKAATKAFVVNRVGDFGFLLAILLSFYLFSTGTIAEISQRIAQYPVGAPVITLLALLFFCGAAAKSAQLPLHVWLADAMEGPTPVSALIHAATMVTAGVYLVVRLHILFMHAPIALFVVGTVGLMTAVFAALCAVGQTDLKRVLAYSTVSQLGFMFLACGIGAFYPAMFHLTMHAFVKALLFLSAGNVVHMLHGVTDMEVMGGLRKPFRITHVMFFIGVLALSGVPPLAAFFSKDLILEEEYLAGFHTYFYIGLATSVLTAFYLTRAYCLTFLGHPRSNVINDAQEAPKVMLIPVGILAVLSIIGGFMGFAINMPPILENFLEQIDFTEKYHVDEGFHLHWETWLSMAGAFVGVGSAFVIYTKFLDKLGHHVQLLKQAFYFDDFYDLIVVRPLKGLARFIDLFLEPKVFTGSIDGITAGIQRISVVLQRIQSGQIRSYIAWMALGMVIIVVFLFM